MERGELSDSLTRRRLDLSTVVRLYTHSVTPGALSYAPRKAADTLRSSPLLLISLITSHPLSMTTTIETLPFELLELILLYTVADPALGTSSSSSSFSTRNRFLREACLLSRAFRYPAQAVLWSSIRVNSAGGAKRILASSVLGQYGTRQLDLIGVSGGDGLSGTTAARVLSKLRAVQSLRLADFGRLSAKVLQSETLTGSSFSFSPCPLFCLFLHD